MGDAALAVDPLTGSGVVRALRMAESAASTVSALLDGSGTRALTDSEASRDDECTAYLTERARQYAGVRRFGTPFWDRRRLTVPA